MELITKYVMFHCISVYLLHVHTCFAPPFCQSNTWPRGCVLCNFDTTSAFMSLLLLLKLHNCYIKAVVHSHCYLSAPDHQLVE